LEQTLYLGWVSIIFAAIAIKKYRTLPEYLFYIKFLIFLALAAFLVSMPPYFDLLLFKAYFPSFLLYKVLPMFRAYARFGILVILSTMTLAGFGIKFSMDLLKDSPTKLISLKLAIIALILFEFINIPPLHCTNLDDKIPLVYSWLRDQPGDFAIAEYPMRSGDTSEGYINLNYLFYQRIHQKKLIESVLPVPEALKIRDRITDITVPGAVPQLKKMGIKYVIVHLDRYRTEEEPLALKQVRDLRLVKVLDKDEIYELLP